MNHTPGPWAWMKCNHTGGIELATPHSGHLLVMDFVRRGFQSAEPRFATWKGIDEGAPRERLGGIMRPVTAMIDTHPSGCLVHPDAELIAAAPELLAACKAAYDELDGYADFGQSVKASHICEQLRTAIRNAETTVWEMRHTKASTEGEKA